MENLATVNVELGINAQKFIQQVQLNNIEIESQISKGIELALEDITSGDNFIQVIRQNTKKELIDIVNKSVMSWEIRNKISKIVEQKIGEKIDLFANEIADKVTSSLNK